MIHVPASGIAQSTPAGSALAGPLGQAYPFGPVAGCELMRRGFNHVYGVRFADGRRAVARLSASRPRGAPNLRYEAAFLGHLRTAGIPVAAPIPATGGDLVLPVALPEGERALMLFEHLDGETPGDTLTDVEATGRGLALLHEAGARYDGPESLYVLELPHLLEASFERLRAAPTMNDELRGQLGALAGRLGERLGAMEGLSRVACHGDCHGSNNFVTDGPHGSRVAAFFDFEEAGPGLLAYELCVYLWALYPRTAGKGLDEKQLGQWRSYLAGYRGVRPIGEADFRAIAPFMAVRQFWLMGEYAGRIPTWGTEAMPTSWLRKQVALLEGWETLETPA